MVARVLENNVTNARKRAFCWGIAIHSLADAFAHSTCYTNGKAIIHGNNDAADNIEIARSRHTAAKELLKGKGDHYEKNIYSSNYHCCIYGNVRAILSRKERQCSG